MATLVLVVVEVDQLLTAMLATAVLVAVLVQEVAQQVMVVLAYLVKVKQAVVVLDFSQLAAVQAVAVKVVLV
jgi:hypothetical protein